jgi:hypothetical protein
MDKFLTTILEVVRDMPATGAAGFEGLVARVLEAVLGVPFRLSSSGSQRGLDGRSVGDGAVVFEAKRYNGDIPRESVLTKILDAGNNSEEADLWILAATTRVPAQLAQDVARAGEQFGLATVVVDWPDADCPPLAVLLAMAERAVLAFFESHAMTVDLPALAASLSDVRHRPSFATQRENLTAAISEPTIGLPLARRAATARLRHIFSAETTARQYLGQALAPRSPSVRSVPRATLSQQISNAFTATSEKMVAVLGAEGHGKSWLVADAWLSLPDPPLTAFVPSEMLVVDHHPPDAGRTVGDLLLHATKGDTRHDSRRRWERMWDRWGRLGPSSVPRFVLVVDGLNQHPSTEWGRLCEALSTEAYAHGGQLVVTCRDGFFNTRVKPRLAVGATVIPVPAWSGEERDSILLRNRVNPLALSPAVRETLCNPRILAVALALLSSAAIETLEELTVSRLLFEHLRLADKDQGHTLSADQFSAKLRKLATEALERVKAEVVDDVFVFEGGLDAASEGRFFRVVDGEHGRFELVDDGADLALGLALMDVAAISERNSRNTQERLAAVLEPIAALDKTANALFAAVTIACLSQGAPDVVSTALILALFRSQNIDGRFFAPLSSLVQRRAGPFLAAMQTDVAVLTRGTVGHCMLEALRRARSQPELWATMSAYISQWLRTYSLSATDRYVDGGQSAHDKETARDRERGEIDSRVRALEPPELDVLANSSRNDAFDSVGLSELTFALMAGMPLAGFATDLVAWRLAAALRPSVEVPTTEFGHLIGFNVSDWDQTRQALLKACEVLRGDTSEAGKWALCGILAATGESADAIEAERLRKKLLEARESPDWIRQPEAAPDPYDPSAQPPEDLNSKREEYLRLPANELRTQVGTTAKDWAFLRLVPVVARFAPDLGSAKILELLADVLTRNGLPLRQGLLELRRHNMLIERDDALRLVQRVHDGSAIAASDLSDSDRLMVLQYHLLLAFPQLSAVEQIDAMTTPHSTTNFFLELLPQVKALSAEDFASRFREAHRNGARVELYVLLAFSASKKLRLPSSLLAPLLSIALGEDAELRARAQALILADNDPELLRNFAASGWNAQRIDEGRSQERWLGSWILIEGARLGLSDASPILERIEPALWTAAALSLGGSVAEEVASRMSTAFDRAAGLSRELVTPDLELSHGVHVEKAMPRFRISPPNDARQSLQDVLKRASESANDFGKRQEGARTQFDAFKRELSKSDAFVVLQSLDVAEVKALLAARPSLLDEWTSLILHHPAANLTALHNIGITLAEAISEEKPSLARDLLQRLSRTSPYVRQVSLGRQVELAAEVTWNAHDGPDLRAVRYARIDAGANDNEVAVEVLAALNAGRTSTLEDYVSDRLGSGLPSRMARALTVCGFCLPTAFNEDALCKHADHGGLVGIACRAALAAYKRHVWMEHWCSEMLRAENNRRLWQTSQLFRGSVDARFEVIRQRLPYGSELFECYKASIFADLHNLYNKHANERKKLLFGAKPPGMAFLPQ